jgi:hypothetical protein
MNVWVAPTGAIGEAQPITQMGGRPPTWHAWSADGRFEGHGFKRPENALANHALAEAFLARHLGGRAEPVGSDFEGSSAEIRAGGDILEASAR